MNEDGDSGREEVEGSKAPRGDPGRRRPLRFVVLDDEPFVVEALRMMLNFDFADSVILTYTDAESALQELQRQEPDLFTTDWNHGGRLHGEGLLQVLRDMKVRYPVFVISAMADYIREGQVLQQYQDLGLTVTLLSKPFTMDEFRRAISLHLCAD